MKILELILPFALNLVSRWLHHGDQRDETIEKYLEFIDRLEHSDSRSKKIELQVEKLRQELHSGESSFNHPE